VAGVGDTAVNRDKEGRIIWKEARRTLFHPRAPWHEGGRRHPDQSPDIRAAQEGLGGKLLEATVQTPGEGGQNPTIFTNNEMWGISQSESRGYCRFSDLLITSNSAEFINNYI
jgi:hypothetical protein